jgi:hypothetical protein
MHGIVKLSTVLTQYAAIASGAVSQQHGAMTFGAMLLALVIIDEG